MSSDLIRKSGDLGWDYGEKCNEINRDKVKCRLCNKIMNGGITRLKQHVAGVGGQVSACKKATLADKERCKSAIQDVKRRKNEVQERLQEVRDEVNIGGEEIISGSSKKPSRSLGPMDQFARPIQLSVLPSKELKQKRVDDALFKKRTGEVQAILAKWVYASGVPFNCINNDYWTQLCEAIGQFGPGFESPTQYKLREPLLKQQVEKMKASLEKYKEEWKKSGCSIMTDAWSDRKRRSIMNLCVNCKLGTTFLSSKEDSMEEHTGRYIFEYVDGFIEKEIGAENVVQVVTDNAANNMAAAKMLKLKRPNIFWTSCAAHTINLILEGIGNLPKFKKIIQKAKALTIFIYSHHKTLALMRKYCKNKEIVRPGATRFATSFLTLQSLLEKKPKLREMFFSEAYSNCKHSRTNLGKKAEATAISNTFWGDVALCLQIFEPLVRVLKLVDGDVKPSMGFVVGYLNEAKEKISSVCLLQGGNELLESIFSIIESKSKDRLDSYLHLTGYLLNPIYYYTNKDENLERRCEKAFHLVCDSLFPGPENQVVIGDELLKYQMKHEFFGRVTTITAWKKYTDVEFDPVGWWMLYGIDTPNLRKLAIRILSLTSSSSGCERNWSAFEGIHTKKRNRLDATRLNDLVFVQFNSKLQNKRERSSQPKDSLLCNDETMAQGWKVKGGDEETRDGGDEETHDGLPHEIIADAMGADEVMEDRRSARNKEKMALVDEDEEEEESDDDEIEEDEDDESIPSDSAEDEED